MEKVVSEKYALSNIDIKVLTNPIIISSAAEKKVLSEKKKLKALESGRKNK